MIAAILAALPPYLAYQIFAIAGLAGFIVTIRSVARCGTDRSR